MVGGGLIGGAVDQQPGPQPACTERVQLAASPVADVGGSGVEALITHGRELPRHPSDELLTAGIRLGEHPAEQIDDDTGPAGGLAVCGQDAEQTAGCHRSGGQRALSLQRPLEFLALGASAVREHRLGHRDERHRVRHGEQGMPNSSAAVINRGGAHWCGNTAPSPSATACTPAASRPARYSRQPSTVSGSRSPMVRSSSPPCSHGPGLASSDTAAASISRSAPRVAGHQLEPADPGRRPARRL